MTGLELENNYIYILFSNSIYYLPLVLPHPLVFALSHWLPFVCVIIHCAHLYICVCMYSHQWLNPTCEEKQWGL